ncbi:MAG: aldo/keto reductase, partial [Chloroflexota bacterium]
MTNQKVKQIADNVQIPMVGLGTYLIENDQVSSVVQEAIKIGYRHIDTAEGYSNEEGVGRGIDNAMTANNLTRDDIFVTTKLWPGNPAWGQTAKTKQTTIDSLNQSLDQLGLDFVDLYLIHAPYLAEDRLEQWKGMAELQQQGKAKAIGVSNFNISHIEELKAVGLPIPAVNQIELHPWSQKPELVSYLTDNGITAIAYS